MHLYSRPGGKRGKEIHMEHQSVEGQNMAQEHIFIAFI
nr:MAG TPA: hypothetical protein [Bacteriophage sp.]